MSNDIADKIEEILQQYRRDHHYAGASDHPVMKSNIDRDIENMKMELTDLLHSYADKQKEICAERFLGPDIGKDKPWTATRIRNAEYPEINTNQ